MKNLGKNGKKALSIFLAGLTAWFTLTTATPKKVEAGVGARAMGMGGAYVSVADDATCTYWNPAGLADTKEQATVIIDPSLNYNYSGFAGYAKPLKHNDGFAVSLTERGEPYRGKKGGDRQLWLSAGYGKQVNEKLALGANLSLKARTLDGKLQKFQINPEIGKFSSVDCDLGALYKKGNFRFGLLLQSLTNVRPGVSYSNGKTTLAVDYYDALGCYEKYKRKNKPGQGICAGIEHKLNDRLAVRAGYYKVTPTFGIGLNSKNGKWQANYGYIPKWKGHLIGLTKKF